MIVEKLKTEVALVGQVRIIGFYQKMLKPTTVEVEFEGRTYRLQPGDILDVRLKTSFDRSPNSVLG